LKWSFCCVCVDEWLLKVVEAAAGWAVQLSLAFGGVEGTLCAIATEASSHIETIAPRRYFMTVGLLWGYRHLCTPFASRQVRLVTHVVRMAAHP
jgi:hypothetical protein